ncbi:hypothetical protein [Dyadobacter subterraneus]
MGICFDLFNPSPVSAGKKLPFAQYNANTILRKANWLNNLI